MQVYRDITLLPSADIGHYFLWEKVYQQLHLALVDNLSETGDSVYGFSFPEFNEKEHRLGRKLRVFAPDVGLMESLNVEYWLARLSDYVHLTSIRQTPEHPKGFVRFKRIQTKTSNERLARREAKRKNISFEEALAMRQNFEFKGADAPFIQMKSHSKEKHFKLFIKQEFVEQSAGETFTSYGLSRSGAVPNF